jgi:hypothetical protein
MPRVRRVGDLVRTTASAVRCTKQATTEPCGFGGRLEVTPVDWVQTIDNAYVDRTTTRTEGQTSCRVIVR